MDLVVAFDVLEHIEDDDSAVAHVFRALRPGGRYLVAVPCDPRLWSAHDEAVGHVRRYTRDGLESLLRRGGFEVDQLRSWNVLLRPVAKLRRRKKAGPDDSTSEMEHVAAPVNAGLRAALAVESLLPVGRRKGLSLVVQAHKP